ncbi:MAG: ribonuclease J [Alphaproteobacteria bacterium]|nr:ribonuclease J [Alphaproteobacteria bacterium]
MKPNRLIYLPLGGAGEIGMNCDVYGYGPEGRERLIVVDLGVTFPEMETSPGVDLIMPDVSWLAERADRIEGIFITHGHEDHVGAVGHLWPRLSAPVHARPFTARLAQSKLIEQGHDARIVTAHAPRPEWVEAGPFRVQFVPVSHSIPETSMLLIETPMGRILHGSDFKIDRTPGVGEAWDEAMLREIGDEGVRVLTCDSTNIFVPHPGRSESALIEPIGELVKSARGMVAATTFASNLARVRTLARSGQAAGRSVCLMGRAMRQMVQTATETGLLTGMPPLIAPEDAAELPRDQVMLIVTGTQGERRAASAQLSRGKYLGHEMKAGDLFLLSSRTIPGNERAVTRVMNGFSELGVDVIDDQGGRYHVSGHANRPDIEALYALIRPRLVIPQHGEHRHLREHARLAASHGIVSDVVTNGMMLDLTEDRIDVAEYIETGRVYLDGSVLIGAIDGVVRDRIRLALNGHVTVTVVLDEDDAPLGEAWADLMGLPATGKRGGALSEAIEASLATFLGRADARTLRDDARLDEAIRRVVRQTSLEEIGKKPEVTVVVSRLSAG